MPPGRRSISQSTVVQGAGVSHFLTCSGFVQASQTKQRGTSTVRFRTSSKRSLPRWLLSGMFPPSAPLGVQFADISFHSVEPRAPERVLPVDPGFRVIERAGQHAAGPHTPDLLATDQPALLQHLQMLQQRGHGHGKRLGDLADRRRAAAQSVDDRAPRRVGQRLEYAIEATAIVRHMPNYNGGKRPSRRLVYRGAAENVWRQQFIASRRPELVIKSRRPYLSLVPPRQCHTHAPRDLEMTADSDLAPPPVPPDRAAARRATAAVDAVYRAESRRVLATLIRLLRDFDLAEEAMHEAFRAAVEQWPKEGTPANPRAWLVSAGRFKAIDVLRRRARFDASQAEIAHQIETEAAQADPLDREDVEDDRLRLIFTCC